MSRLKELQNQKAELEKQIEAESKVHFKERCEELFAKYPVIEEFSWKQYTPSFNDGEPCEFSVHGDWPEINEMDKYDSTEKDIPKEAYKAVSEIINEIDENTMESLFGNGVEVTIKRGEAKAIIDEYYE